MMFDPTTTPTGAYRAGKKRDAVLGQVLAAAEHEFAAKGYAGASVQAIADRAGLPKSNVQYYFKRKANLYVSVLNSIVELWNTSLSGIHASDDPAIALDRFIREKTRLAFTHPRASRLFAMEIVSGAPHLSDYIATDMRAWVMARAEVIQHWVDTRQMQPVDPRQFIFLVWSSTQHYADFEAQTLLLLNRSSYTESMIDEVADFLADTLLRGVGLRAPRQPARAKEASASARSVSEPSAPEPSAPSDSDSDKGKPPRSSSVSSTSLRGRGKTVRRRR